MCQPIDDERYWVVDDGDPDGANFCLLDRGIDQVIAYYDDEAKAIKKADELNRESGLRYYYGPPLTRELAIFELVHAGLIDPPTIAIALPA